MQVIRLVQAHIDTLQQWCNTVSLIFRALAAVSQALLNGARSQSAIAAAQTRCG